MLEGLELCNNVIPNRVSDYTPLLFLREGVGDEFGMAHHKIELTLNPSLEKRGTYITFLLVYHK